MFTFLMQMPKHISIACKLIALTYITYISILTATAGGGPPWGGGKKAGLTCGAGAVGWPGGGKDIGGFAGGIPIIKIVNT